MDPHVEVAMYRRHYEEAMTTIGELRDELWALRKENVRLSDALTEAMAAQYPGCKILSLGDQCPCKICSLERKLAAATLALRNCRMVASRQLNYWTLEEKDHQATAWRLILKFCKEAGIEASVLREDGADAGRIEGRRIDGE